MSSSPRPARPPLRHEWASTSSLSLSGLERTVPPSFPSPALSARSSSSLHKPLPPTPLDTSKSKTSSIYSRTQEEIIDSYLYRGNEPGKLHPGLLPYTLFSEASKSLQTLHTSPWNSRELDAHQDVYGSAPKFTASDSALVMPVSAVSPPQSYDGTFRHDLLGQEVSPLTPSPPPLSPWPFEGTDHRLKGPPSDKSEALARTYRDTLLPDPFIASSTTSLEIRGDAVPLTGPRSPKRPFDTEIQHLAPAMKVRSDSQASISTVSSNLSTSHGAQLRALALRAEQRPSPLSSTQPMSSPFKPPPMAQTQTEQNGHIRPLPSPIQPAIGLSVKSTPHLSEKNFVSKSKPLKQAKQQISASLPFSSDLDLIGSPAPKKLTSITKSLSSNQLTVVSDSGRASTIPSTPYQIMDLDHEKESRQDKLLKKKSRFSLLGKAKRISETSRSSKSPTSPKPTKLQKSPRKFDRKGVDDWVGLVSEQETDPITSVQNSFYGVSANPSSWVALEDTETYETSARAAAAASQMYAAPPFNRSQTWPSEGSDPETTNEKQKTNTSQYHSNQRHHAATSSAATSSSIPLTVSPSAYISDPPASPFQPGRPARTATAPLPNPTVAAGSHTRTISAATTSSFTSTSSSTGPSTNKAQKPKKLSWLRRPHPPTTSTSPKSADKAARRREEIKKSITVKGMEQTSVVALRPWLNRAGSMSGSPGGEEESQREVRGEVRGQVRGQPEWVVQMRRGLVSVGGGEWEYDFDEEGDEGGREGYEEEGGEGEVVRIGEGAERRVEGGVSTVGAGSGGGFVVRGAEGESLGRYRYESGVDAVGGSWL